MYIALRDVNRLRRVGLKISPKVLLTLAKSLANHSIHMFFIAGYLNPLDQVPTLEKLTPRWIQSFQDNHNIVYPAQIGKFTITACKQEYIESSIAFHFGILKRQFESRELNEDLIEMQTRRIPLSLVPIEDSWLQR